VFVARSPIARLIEAKKARGWTRHRIYSDPSGDYTREYVSKEDLFRNADIVTIHVQLGQRNRGLITAKEIGLMKKTAYIVNTSRGPIIDEKALLDALNSKQIAGAGLDVYDVEPLPLDHPFRKLDNVVITPHLGYVSQQNYAKYYPDIVEDIRGWIDGKPVRIVAPR